MIMIIITTYHNVIQEWRNGQMHLVAVGAAHVRGRPYAKAVCVYT